MTVVVIGAGFAGLSAAVRLADAGLKVIVVDESPRLGGRATSFIDRETGERVDNGQHVLFGCYRETYAFLRRLGTDHQAPLEPRLTLTFADTDGRTSTFTCPSWQPPWHLVAGILRWRGIPFADRMTALQLRSVLLQIRRTGAAAVAALVPADLTVAEWLEQHGQSPVLCEWLWHPLAVAALNQSPDRAAAGPFVRVLGELFGPGAEDSAIGLASVPLDDLYAHPARDFISARGGVVMSKSQARIELDANGAVSGVQAGGTHIATTAVVSSVPWHALGRIWSGSIPPAMQGIADNAASTESSPIVTVNLWFDGPVMSARFLGLIGGPMHWVFDKSAIIGQSAGHLSIVASGADELAALDNRAIANAAIEQLAGALPATRGRHVRRVVVVREHRATFSLAPGSPPRPGTTTPVRGLYLAGDWIDTGLPGTIEGAVISGHRAADAVLRYLS